MSGHILVRIIREAYKKTRIESIILIHVWSMQSWKIEKSCFFAFLKKYFFDPSPTKLLISQAQYIRFH